MSDVAMQEPVIACHGLSKSFREGDDAVEVLSNVSLAVGRGEREPAVDTPDEVAEPRNRRSEIIVR